MDDESAISQLSKEKLEECKNIFNSNDINNKGSIPSNRLVFILRNLGAYVPPEDLEEFIGNIFNIYLIFNLYLFFLHFHIIEFYDAVLVSPTKDSSPSFPY